MHALHSSASCLCSSFWCSSDSSTSVFYWSRVFHEVFLFCLFSLYMHFSTCHFTASSACYWRSFCCLSVSSTFCQRCSSYFSICSSSAWKNSINWLVSIFFFLINYHWHYFLQNLLFPLLKILSHVRQHWYSGHTDRKITRCNWTGPFWNPVYTVYLHLLAL